MRPFAMGMVAAATAVLLAGGAEAQNKVLRLGNDIAPQSVQAQACDVFAKEVAARNVGLEIKVFHANQLGTGVQQIQNVKLGVQEMVNTGPELFDVYSSDLRIISVPFAFENREHLEAMLRSKTFEKIQGELIKNGGQRFINTNVVWKRGPYRVMIASKPILNLDDLSKIKVRVHESEAVKRFWGKQGLGATVVVLPLADVYLSVRQGVVDAINMPLDLIVPFKFAEVGKHVMNTYEYPQFVSISINEQTWQSLNEAQRKAILESVDKAGQFYNSEIEKNVDAWKKQITDLGAKFHDIDRKPFIDRMRERNVQWEKEGYWRPGLMSELEALRPKK